MGDFRKKQGDEELDPAFQQFGQLQANPNVDLNAEKLRQAQLQGAAIKDPEILRRIDQTKQELAGENPASSDITVRSPDEMQDQAIIRKYFNSMNGSQVLPEDQMSALEAQYQQIMKRKALQRMMK